MSAVGATELKLLKGFVQMLKANPAAIWLPELDLYREYLLSLGAKLPEKRKRHGPRRNRKRQREAVVEEQRHVMRHRNPSVLLRPHHQNLRARRAMWSWTWRG